MLKSLDTNYTVHGTNLGLYSSVDKLDTFYIENPNKNVDLKLKLFVTVLGYKKMGELLYAYNSIVSFSKLCKNLTGNKEK